MSHCAIDEGVNAGNIRRCVEMLAASGYDGILSLECEGQGGPMIEQGLGWMRRLLAEVSAAAARA